MQGGGGTVILQGADWVDNTYVIQAGRDLTIRSGADSCTAIFSDSHILSGSVPVSAHLTGSVRQEHNIGQAVARGAMVLG